MIVDTFLFNNEFDMLDIRIALTSSWVDRWVVCEGNRTLSGQLKPYYLSDNIDRYKPLGDRLRVIKLDIPETWSNWDIENGQRSALLPGYQYCQDSDIIMHSDLDEILNSNQVPAIIRHVEQTNQPISCTLDMYIYKFDQRLDRKWNGNVVAKKHMFEDPCKLYKGLKAGVGTAQKKKDRTHCAFFPEVAGWHWSWMGSDEVVANKIKSCIETQHRDVDQMLENFHNLQPETAINHKCQTTQVDPNYPESVMTVLKKYPYWT